MPGVRVWTRDGETLDAVMAVARDAIAVGLEPFAPKNWTAGMIADRVSFKTARVVKPPESITLKAEVAVSTTLVGTGFMDEAADAVLKWLLAKLEANGVPLHRVSIAVRVEPLFEGNAHHGISF